MNEMHAAISFLPTVHEKISLIYTRCSTKRHVIKRIGNENGPVWLSVLKDLLVNM